MKAYAQFRPELDDSAAVIAHVAANETQYTIGTFITAKNGDLSHVSAVGVATAITPPPAPAA